VQRYLVFGTWFLGGLLSVVQVLCVLGFFIGRADNPNISFSIANAVWANLILSILSIFQDIVYLRRPSRNKLRFHFFVFWADIAIIFIQVVLVGVKKPVLQLALLPSHLTFYRTALFNFSNFLSGEEPFFWTEDGSEFFWGLIRSFFGRLPRNLRLR